MPWPPVSANDPSMHPLRRLSVLLISLGGLYCLGVAAFEPLLTMRLRANALFIPLVAEDRSLVLLSAIGDLFRDGHWALGLFLLTFALLLPCICLLTGLYLGLSPRRTIRRHHRTARRIALLGRLCLLDVFIIALLVMTLTVEGWISFHSHPALFHLIGAGILALLNAHLMTRPN